MSLSDEDSVRWIRDQEWTVAAALGRERSGLVPFRVETRCPSGHPQVIQSYPLRGRNHQKEPFPTLFWLACPTLQREIAELERVGHLVQFEARLEADPTLWIRWQQQQRNYIDERWQLLTEEDRRLVDAKGWKPLFKEAGIGGIRDWRHLKCLHLHYAHHKARENLVGGWVENHLPGNSCPAR